MENKSVNLEKNRKNFLKPEFEINEMMNKREQFAVSLRKQKTKAIVQ